jgi:hypothetical protein
MIKTQVEREKEREKERVCLERCAMFCKPIVSTPIKVAQIGSRIMKKKHPPPQQQQQHKLLYKCF